MYFRIVGQCVEALRAVETFLDKAEAFATKRKFDVHMLLNGRLAPDMKGLIYQVQSACDYTKAAAAWLSGQTPPKHDDFEQSIGEVRERLRKTIAFAESIPEAQYEGAASRKVSVSWEPGKVIDGEDYALQMSLPNVYFHVAMVYAILRANGVDVGKMDFLGHVNFVPV